MISSEYYNVPMKRAFENTKLATEIEQILGNDTKITISCLSKINYTFRQFLCLHEHMSQEEMLTFISSGVEERKKLKTPIGDSGNGYESIPKEKYYEILEVMELWEQKAPIPIEEMYPFLQEEHWKLPMSQVSNMKVDLTYGEEWGFDIESIEKIESDCNEPLLILYPYDYEEDSQFKIIDNKKQFQILFQDRDELNQFVKDILLNGTVDFRKYKKGELL